MMTENSIPSSSSPTNSLKVETEPHISSQKRVTFSQPFDYQPYQKISRNRNLYHCNDYNNDSYIDEIRSSFHFSVSSIPSIILYLLCIAIYVSYAFKFADNKISFASSFHVLLSPFFLFIYGIIKTTVNNKSLDFSYLRDDIDCK